MQKNITMNPNETAVEITEKYLQGKSHDFIIATVRHLTEIAGTNCKLPILKEES